MSRVPLQEKVSGLEFRLREIGKNWQSIIFSTENFDQLKENAINATCIFWKLNSDRIQSYLWSYLKSCCRRDIKRDTQKHCFIANVFVMRQCSQVTNRRKADFGGIFANEQHFIHDWRTDLWVSGCRAGLSPSPCCTARSRAVTVALLMR